MVISFFNHKGGTGKTTTTLNLGVALAERGYKVLMVDFDLQANLSYSMGSHCENSLDQVLKSNVDILSCLEQKENVWLLPNSPAKFGSDQNLIDPFTLSNSLDAARGMFDFIFVDCAPTISNHALNALCASDFVVVPFQLDVLSIQGLHQVINSINHINTTFHRQLQIIGVLPVMVDKRRMLTQEVLDYIRKNYQVDVFSNYVRSNVKVAEAPSFGHSVLSYDSKSNGSADYRKLATEFLQKVEQLNVTAGSTQTAIG